MELRNLAEELHREAYDLERAADVLRILREYPHKDKVQSARAWAKWWMKT
jgi:hypothetical protein